MKIKDALNQENSNNIGLFESELLLSFVLKKSRAYLLAYPDEELSIEYLNDFFQLLARRKRGEPIAYIFGKKEFWSKEFSVNTHTLIPRPETELLIETVLENFSTTFSYRFLELGTGSGIISVTLASLYPNSQMLATDISEAALQIAKKNKVNFKADNLTLLKSDWFTSVSSSRQFDLIISNPPYLSENDPHLGGQDLRFEPKTALIAGPSGIECLEKIIKNAKKYMKPNGILMLEHGYDQANRVKEIFEQSGFFEVTLKKDLNNLSRVTIGKNLL